MCNTQTSDQGLSSRSQPTGGGALRTRRALTLAAVAMVAVLGPGAYAAPAASAGATHAAVATKHKKSKHKCKKGFVYQHGRCVASSRPVY